MYNSRCFTFLILCLLLLVPCTLTAQNWDVVKTSPDYVWGEGMGATIDEADKRALADLTTNIAVFVQSDFEMTLTNEQEGQNVSSSSYAASRMKTYSQATLTNTERIILAEEPQVRVGRWIKKSEVDKLFQLRQTKAQDMVASALRAEEAGKVDDALRYYYWAYVLTQSLRYPSKAQCEDADGRQHLMMTWVPQQMRQVMDDVSCNVMGRKGDDIEVAFTFRGRPVSSLDFTYFDGRDWMPITSATGGTGLMEMADGFAGQTLQVRLEYEYRSEAHIDRELAGVMEVVPSLSFPKAKKTFDSKAGGEAAPAVQAGRTTGPVVAATPASVTDDKAYDAAMKKVLAAIRNGSYQTAGECFTEEGRDIFQRLVKYGAARIVGTPQPVFHRSARSYFIRFKYARWTCGYKQSNKSRH